MSPTTRTDPDGHYCFSELPAGTYGLSANDPENSYPDVNLTFYDSGTNQHIVVVRANSQTLHADWRIPYKAAGILIQLTDAETGESLSTLQFDMTVRSAPARHLEGAVPATLPLLIPPDEPVILMVRSPGYKAFRGDTGRGLLLSLAAGSNKTLQLALHREP